MNNLLLVILDLCLCIFGVNSVFFFRSVLLLREQKVIGVFMFMEIEVFVWIFFCMNIDVYYFNGLI